MGDDGFSFPLPSQIEDVPGAEGWRSMYQYFTRFQPEDDNRFWFHNAMHFPEPIPAFDSITSEVPYTATPRPANSPPRGRPRREPSFHRLRADKPGRITPRERAKSVESCGRPPPLVPDFPKPGRTVTV